MEIIILHIHRTQNVNCRKIHLRSILGEKKRLIMMLFKHFKEPAGVSLLYKQFRQNSVRQFPYEQGIAEPCLEERN